jgi:glyoxylase-like metal-dependent hydrolase (beta-lactamase superfamily II)
VSLSTRIDRRTFLVDFGRGAVALAIVGIAGCGPSTVQSIAPTAAASPPEPSGPADPASPLSTAGSASAPPESRSGAGASWERVDLGFVSAYLLVRGGEAALVDTGVAGSEAAIEASLGSLGLDWSAVAHVILTHHHDDHQGSLRAIQGLAADASTYAGLEDVASIATDRAVTAVVDGERVFDLQIVTTPGHTAGSISVLDPRSGVLVAGDALRAENGRPALPGEQFTIDMDEAKRSAVKLGGLAFETLLVGHGDPIEGGASALVAELGASA